MTTSAELRDKPIKPTGSKGQYITRDLKPYEGQPVTVTTDNGERHGGVLVAAKGNQKYTGAVLIVETPYGVLTLFPAGTGKYTTIEKGGDGTSSDSWGGPAASSQDETLGENVSLTCPAEGSTDDGLLMSTTRSGPYITASEHVDMDGAADSATKELDDHDVYGGRALMVAENHETAVGQALNELEVVKGELVAARPAEVLVLIDQARAELASVQDPAEAASFVEHADAIAYLAKKAQASEAVQNQAAELALRAKRRAGELLAGREAPRGRRTDLEPRDMLSPSPAPTLKELGVEFHDSKRWQRIAAVPEEDFEGYVGDKTRELTTAGLLATANSRAKAERQRQVAWDLADGEVEGISGLFPTIVVNPSWHRDTFKQLEALELPAADDAHLYLWVTNEMLRRGFDFFDQWRFTYKACLTWLKPQSHLGNWFPDATEQVLFGVRGRLPLLRDEPLRGASRRRLG